MSTAAWVIRKNGYFYRPDRAGYTADIKSAGRYSEREAKMEASIEPRCMSAHPADEFENGQKPYCIHGPADYDLCKICNPGKGNL